MQELIIEKLSGDIIRKRYVNWTTFERTELDRLKLLLETELEKVKDMLLEMDK